MYQFPFVSVRLYRDMFTSFTRIRNAQRNSTCDEKEKENLEMQFEKKVRFRSFHLKNHTLACFTRLWIPS